MADDKRVSLGCGTLILIALIVLIFSNQNRSGDNEAVQNELRKLQTQVSELRNAINEQTEVIEKLQRALEQEP